ncbi:hypothetical protein E4U42_003047 [Claviceps africana]|uniref:Uncharacterized protein n=1 Tax=Claviceps africana TaxID=83212 RepID=A0A8K0J7D0_9HYPO|nr:hypothetical protein E4U42_003047 [Claviceps africana]
MVWDAIFLCFDVKEKMGLLRILSWFAASGDSRQRRLTLGYQKWQHAVEQDFGASSVPLIYLLGLKKDLRMECSFEDHRLAMEAGLTIGSPSCCVNPREASWHARRIGAERYAECSALTGEGVGSVMDEVGRRALERMMGNEAGQGGVRVVRRRLV